MSLGSSPEYLDWIRNEEQQREFMEWQMECLQHAIARRTEPDPQLDLDLETPCTSMTSSQANT